MKKFFVILFTLFPVFVFAASFPPPGSNNQLVYNSSGLWAAATLGAGCSISGGSFTCTGSVTSVSNSDSSLTISPTTGSVVASLNIGHANSWTALQTFGSGVSINGNSGGNTVVSTLSGATNSWVFTDYGTLNANYPQFLMRASGGTSGSPTQLLGSGNAIWGIYGSGMQSNGVFSGNAGGLEMAAVDNFTTTTWGTEFYFYAVPTGTTLNTNLAAYLTGNSLFDLGNSSYAGTFQLESTSLGSNYHQLESASTGGGEVLYFPNVTSGDTLVSLAATQTLTNKTLTAPVLSGTITGTYTLGGTPSMAATALTGLGTGVGTALGTAVGSTGSFVVNGGALGTPSSGTATNLTGTAAGLTAGIANAVASATTTVNTSSATAPTIGQILEANSGTAATWQTPPGTIPGLALFLRDWASINTGIVRIENMADSILTCNQQAPCTYGPQRVGSTFALLLIDELAQRFQQYSTGFRAIVRLSNATTTVSAGDGYTLTSGTLTNSTLLGPQESGVSLNGGSLLTLSSAGVITISVGQPYSSVNIACVQGTGITGYTVTINGSSVGTACGSGSGSSTATIQNFANPVAFASQPSTGSTLTLTALGATNYLYAYEGVLFCGASNVACTTGFVIDNFGVGGASSPWFASGTKTGGTDGGMVWVKALSGQVAMCVLENGENDAQASSGPVTSAQQNAQNQIVATDCINKNASVLWFGPPPFNDGGTPAVYAGLQQGALSYCEAQNWVCLNMADLFLGDQSGTTSSVFPFTAQNTGMGLTPPWGVAQGMITNSDAQHLTDCGELLVTQQFIETLFPMWQSYPVTQACSQNPQPSAISSAYTNATASFTTVQGATANTGQLEFVAPVGQSFTSVCRGYMTVGTTGVVSFQLIGSAAISNVNITLSYQTAANSVYAFASATALSSAMATSSITAASNLRWTLEINGVNSTTANSFAVQAHEASGTMTVPAGATCTTQMNGPQ